MIIKALELLSQSPFAKECTQLKAKLEVLGEHFFKSIELKQEPTLIFFNNGDEVCRSPGFQPATNLAITIESVFKAFAN